MHEDLVQAARDAIECQGGLCQYQSGDVTGTVMAVIQKGVQVQNDIGQASRINTVRVMFADTPNLKKGATFTDQSTEEQFKYMTTLADNGITRLLQVSKTNAEVPD